MARPSRPMTRTWTEPARTRLALLEHDPRRRTGQVVSFLLDPRGATIASAFDVPAMPLDPGSAYSHVVAAHDGADAFAVARADTPDGPWYVDVRDLSSSAPWRSVPIPHAPPAALLISGGWVLVGHAERVSAFRVDDPEGTYTELLHRRVLGGKAYDVFARHGPYVVAIDDMIMPMYADSFKLGSGVPEHIAGYDMPSLVNGHYVRAALDLDANGDGRLFADSRFSHRSGSGQCLVAVPFAGGAPASIPHPTVAITTCESIHRNDDTGARLFAGASMTSWLGLAATPAARSGRVLIAAGTRGLFSLPQNFTSDSKPNIHNIGTITDVLAQGDHVWALRFASDSADVLELTLQPDGTIDAEPLVQIEGAFASFIT